MNSPIVRATAQSAALSAISNVLGQVLQSWRNETPITLNITELFHFILFAILSTPPNFLWQTWLEAQYPGYTKSLPPMEKEKLVDDLVSGQTTSIEPNPNPSNPSHRRPNPEQAKDKILSTDSRASTSKLNLKNTAIKFALDQTLGAAVNNFLFIAGIGLLRGLSFTKIRINLEEQFWPMIFAGQKLWPAVSILSFTVVPVQYRTTFGSIVGLFWGVYVSMLTSQKG